MKKKNNSTNLWQNLKFLYSHYGTWSDFLTSGYLWSSFFFTGLCWRIVVTTNNYWTTFPLSVSPVLAGFSLAMFALLFSILNEKTRNILSRPSDKLNNKAPLLIMSCTLFHAVIVQISSIVFAIIYIAKPVPYIAAFKNFIYPMNIFFSVFGFVLFVYGLVLVIASILSIFRTIEVSAFSS